MLLAHPEARAQDLPGGGETQRYYNIKAGPVYVTLNSSVQTQYTDNVNLSNGKDSPILSDLIITPRVGFTALSELQMFPRERDDIERTTLSLSMNLGYEYHLLQPTLNRNNTDLNVAPDSQIAFRILAGPVKIRVYDQMAMQSDSGSDGSLSNVAQFRRFTNTIGANAEWPINSLTNAHLDVSHRNLWALSIVSLDSSGNATNIGTSAFNNYVDTVSGSINSRVLSFLTLGMGASVSKTTFPSASDQDSTTIAYGPTASFQLSDYTSLDTSAGISESIPSNGPSTTSEYANASLVNRFNQYYTQTLSVGRQLSLSLLGAQTQVDYVRYNGSWRMNSKITLNGTIGIDQTTYLGNGGSLGNIVDTSPYRMLRAQLSTQYRLSRKLDTHLSYTYLKKLADQADDGYSQNMITWDISYAF